MTTAATMLGTLRTEASIYSEIDGVGSPNLTMYRPAGTPLRNDGIWHHWMARGSVYRLTHDRIGWRVTCQTWLSGHVYRLVESQDVQFADRLPLTDSVLELDRSQAYELREVEPYGAWAVYSI